MTTEDQVRAFFTRNGKVPLPEGRDEFLAYRYLDSGTIDSLGIVTLIAELESGGDFQFTADDLESYEFQSIGGLVGIIDRLKATRA